MEGVLFQLTCHLNEVCFTVNAQGDKACPGSIKEKLGFRRCTVELFCLGEKILVVYQTKLD